MRNRFSLLAVLALAAVFAGCRPAPSPTPDTRDADAKAIRDLETAWNQAAVARDLDKITSFYTEDASILDSYAPTITGIAAIRAVTKDSLADKNLFMSFTSSKIEVAKSGDLAYSQGTYTWTGTDPKTRKVMTEQGKFVNVYRKQADGAWKIAADIGNPDAPPVLAK
jgi:uncharacterized protein (TIGR02246 family)